MIRGYSRISYHDRDKFARCDTAIIRFALDRWGASLSAASVTARISTEPIPLKRPTRAALAFNPSLLPDADPSLPQKSRPAVPGAVAKIYGASSPSHPTPAPLMLARAVLVRALLSTSEDEAVPSIRARTAGALHVIS